MQDKRRPEKIVNISNPNIGTLYLETYVNSGGISKVYGRFML